MRGQGRPSGPVASCSLALLFLAGPAAAEPVSSTLTISGRSSNQLATTARDDAELADVFFVDTNRGWAVGDRGVIWHTSDGGRNWEIQPSHVDCRLEAIHFLNEKSGWIAGGYHRPFAGGSQGVLLKTVDGGRSWQPRSRLMLPALKRVHFFDVRRGIALGDSSALYRSGALMTVDGGQSWTALAAESGGDWLAGAAARPQTYIAAGRAGTAAVSRGNAFLSAPIADARWRNVRDLVFADERTAWCTGDGGLVRISNDAGGSWQAPTGALPEAARRSFDWHAVSARGPRCWIAGSPGSRILHTNDGGQNWSMYATGHFTPLKALHFVDDERGWAVGSLGAILSTEDGGQSWRRRRGNAARAALAAIVPDAGSAPLELFAKYGAADGYLGVAIAIARRDLAPDAARSFDLRARLHEAIVSAGGNAAETAWQFPVAQNELRLGARQITDDWNRFNNADAIALLREYLIRQIRLWRPDVIVTSVGGPPGDPLGGLVNSAVVAAVEEAANESRFAEQLENAGLETWRVSKVYEDVGEAESASTRLLATQLMPSLGKTLSDLAAPGWALISRGLGPTPASWGFRSVRDETESDPRRRDLFAGLSIAPGGECRRPVSEVAQQSVREFEVAARSARNFQAILQQASENPRLAAAFWSQLDSLLEPLEPQSGALVLSRYAVALRDGGRLSDAAEAFHELVERYPHEPIAVAALAWLLQYYSGDGPALGDRDHAIAAVGPFQRPDAAEVRVQHATATEDLDKNGSAKGPALLDRVTPGSKNAGQQAQREAGRVPEIAERIRQIDPALHNEPAIRFPLAAALRNTSAQQEAERIYEQVMHQTPQGDPWSRCAAAEIELARGRGIRSKLLLHCVRAGERPYLDAKLEDEVWQRAQRIELDSPRGDDSDWPATAMIAHDREFLYLAVSCRRAAECEYPSPEGPRQRDADLADRDRIELLIDTNRDWNTYSRLVIDSRGWTQESRLESSAWNPAWYVAADDDGRQWTVEAAIALMQLVDAAPKPGTTWGAGIQRVVPGVGFQSWSRPATPAIRPEGFGIVQFE